jgi:hypothetical protein
MAWLGKSEEVGRLQMDWNGGATPDMTAVVSSI